MSALPEMAHQIGEVILREGYLPQIDAWLLVESGVSGSFQHCVDVSKISAAPNKEEEILLNPTGKFKITGVYYNEAASRLEVEAIYER